MKEGRKARLIKGKLCIFDKKGVPNPCGCGCSTFHQEFDGKVLYGVCDKCGEDIHEFSYDPIYINNYEWGDTFSDN